MSENIQTFVPPGITAARKGPRIFLDYDKQELDWAYDQAVWAFNQAEVAKRNAQKCEATLARLGVPRRPCSSGRLLRRTSHAADGAHGHQRREVLCCGGCVRPL